MKVLALHSESCNLSLLGDMMLKHTDFKEIQFWIYISALYTDERSGGAQIISYLLKRDYD